jgi:small nuclear ribonucleoprotein D3
LQDVTRTTAEGKTSHVDYVFIRGSQVLFIVFPNMLRHAPRFKRITLWRTFKGHPPQNLGAATGPRGQAAAIIRKGNI